MATCAAKDNDWRSGPRNSGDKIFSKDLKKDDKSWWSPRHSAKSGASKDSDWHWSPASGSRSSPKVDPISTKSESKSKSGKTDSKAVSTKRSSTKGNEQAASGRSSTKGNKQAASGRSSTKGNERAASGRSSTKGNEQAASGRSSTKGNEQAASGRSSTNGNEQAASGRSSTKGNEQAASGRSSTKGNEQAASGRSSTTGNEQAANGPKQAKAKDAKGKGNDEKEAKGKGKDEKDARKAGSISKTKLELKTDGRSSPKGRSKGSGSAPSKSPKVSPKESPKGSPKGSPRDIQSPKERNRRSSPKFGPNEHVIVLKNLMVEEKEFAAVLTEFDIPAKSVDFYKVNGVFKGTVFVCYEKEDTYHTAFDVLGKKFSGKKVKVQQIRRSNDSFLLEKEDPGQAQIIQAEIKEFADSDEPELQLCLSPSMRKYAHSLAERSSLLHSTKVVDGQKMVVFTKRKSESKLEVDTDFNLTEAVESNDFFEEDVGVPEFTLTGLDDEPIEATTTRADEAGKPDSSPCSDTILNPNAPAFVPNSFSSPALSAKSSPSRRRNRKDRGSAAGLPAFKASPRLIPQPKGPSVSVEGPKGPDGTKGFTRVRTACWGDAVVAPLLEPVQNESILTICHMMMSQQESNLASHPESNLTLGEKDARVAA